MHKALGSQKAVVDSPLPLLKLQSSRQRLKRYRNADFLVVRQSSSTMPISLAPQLDLSSRTDAWEAVDQRERRLIKRLRDFRQEWPALVDSVPLRDLGRVMEKRKSWSRQRVTLKRTRCAENHSVHQTI